MKFLALLLFVICFGCSGLNYAVSDFPGYDGLSDEESNYEQESVQESPPLDEVNDSLNLTLWGRSLNLENSQGPDLFEPFIVNGSL